jgi:myo-inositol-1(or 4)-monophosphatase
MEALSADWLGLCRRAAERVGTALAEYPAVSDRAEETGRGEGGDMSLVIDRAAEDAVFDELEQLGLPLTAISEERGEMAIAGGGPAHVVIDPIDGSLNAKRHLPFYALCLAVASGPTMDCVEFGYVRDLASGEEWHARRGQGAYLGDDRLQPLPGVPGRLEVLGLETARPERVTAIAPALAGSGARRVRVLGSVALSLAYVASGRIDAMITLRPVRSVDLAAAQLLVTEAGGAVRLPDAGDKPSLGLDLRSRVAAARTPDLLDEVCALIDTPED